MIKNYVTEYTCKKCKATWVGHSDECACGGEGVDYEQIRYRIFQVVMIVAMVLIAIGLVFRPLIQCLSEVVK